MSQPSSIPGEAIRCPVCKGACVFDDASHVSYCAECERLLGWLPGSRTYMLHGGSGSGKSVLLYKIMEIYLRNSIPCVYVALDEFPSQVKKGLSKFVKELDRFEADGLMVFFDCYSCVGGLQSTERRFIKTPGDLNEINLSLSETLDELSQKGNVRVFLDSVTPLFTFRDSAAVIKCLLALGAKAKGRGGSLFFTLGTGAVSQEDQKKLEMMSDALIELKLDESGQRPKRYFRVPKIRGMSFYYEWLPFSIGRDTLYFGLPEDPGQMERFRSTIRSMDPPKPPPPLS